MPPPSTTAFSCPSCGADSRIRETREIEPGMVRRRRVCTNGHPFIAWEFAERADFVRKRDGRLERFDDRRLRASIAAASAQDIPINPEPIVEDVIAAVRAPASSGSQTVSTIEIGTRVLRGLRAQDRSGIAALRFGSVFYRHRPYQTRELLIKAIDEVDQPILFVVKRQQQVHPGEEILPRIEPFDDRKLRRSIEHALRKTKQEAAIDRVWQYARETAALTAEEVWEKGELVRQEITAEEIGESVLKHLRKLDLIAWMRYLSVFDPGRFQNELSDRLADEVRAASSRESSSSSG